MPCLPAYTWPIVVSGLAAWVIALFYTMGQTANLFLCPAIEVRETPGVESAILDERRPFKILFAFLQNLAEMLHLDPDLAGVTLFALANGAPDLLTQVSALLTSGQEDVALAARYRSSNSDYMNA